MAIIRAQAPLCFPPHPRHILMWIRHTNRDSTVMYLKHYQNITTSQSYFQELEVLFCPHVSKELIMALVCAPTQRTQRHELQNLPDIQNRIGETTISYAEPITTIPSSSVYSTHNDNLHMGILPLRPTKYNLIFFTFSELQRT